MRKEIVYSFIALGGAIPVTVSAADTNVDVATINQQDDQNKVTIAAAGKFEQDFGLLPKGKYTLKGSLVTRLYKVTIKIGGKTVQYEPDPQNATSVDIEFDLSAATNVKLTMESESTASGSEFTLSNPELQLTFDFEDAKTTLTNRANELKSTISSYTYADKATDVTAAEAILTDINNSLAETKYTFATYKDEGLSDLATSRLQKAIDELAASAGVKQANKLNTDAYNALNDIILARQNYLDAAKTEVIGNLTGAAAYLKTDVENAFKALQDKIDAATAANAESQKGGTAKDDQATNEGKLPTESQIDNVKSNWNSQAQNNKDKYAAMQAELKTQQDKLAAVPANKDNSKADAYNKAKKDAEDAVKAFKDAIEAKYNKKDQLTFATTSDYTKVKNTATNKVNAFVSLAEANNGNIDNYNNLKNEIAERQTNLGKAQTAVNALKSADGKYEPKSDCAAIVKGISDQLTGYLGNAKTAYDNNNASFTIDFTTVDNAIAKYESDAKAAVANYDKVVAALALYNSELEAARAKFSAKEYYNEEGDKYDFKLQFDKIQKNINDIQTNLDNGVAKNGQDGLDAVKGVDDQMFDQTFTSLTAIGDNAFVIVNAADGKVLYGTTYQNLAFDAYANGLKGTNTGYTFKLENSAVSGAYRLHLYTPAGEKYLNKQSWNGTGLCYLNTQPVSGTVSFVADLKQGDNEKEGKDIVNGAAWNIVYEAGKGFALKNVGTAKYLKDASNAKYDEPTYFEFKSVKDGIIGQIAAVVATEYQADNDWAADKLTGTGGTLTTLEERIANTEAKYTAETIGNKLSAYTNDQKVIKDNLSTLKTKINNTDKTAGNAAATLAGYATDVETLAAQQDSLENHYNVIYNGVTANTELKTSLDGDISTLNDKITAFGTTYKQGTSQTTLGLKDTEIATEEADINTKLGVAETAVSGVTPTNVGWSDETSKVDKTVSGWKKEVGNDGGNYQKMSSRTNPYDLIEVWNGNAQKMGNGKVLYQNLTGLPNGVYDVELFVSVKGGAAGDVEAYANDVKVPVTPAELPSTGVAPIIKLNNVVVSDGKLEMGLQKKKSGANWLLIQIKKLNCFYKTADTETLTAQQTAINDLKKRQEDVEKAAKAQKEAVEKNNELKTVADNVITALSTYLNNNTKGLADVTNTDGAYDGYSNPVARKSVNGSFWWVYKTGLDEKETFTAEKKVVTDAISAIETAVGAAYAAEKMKDIIANKGTEEKPNYQIATGSGKTAKDWKETDIKALVDAIKEKADFESKNYWAYRNAVKNNDEASNGLSKALVNAASDLEAKAGKGAYDAYYKPLLDDYQAQRDKLVKEDMVASLNARTAQTTMGDSKKGFIKQIIDLKNLVNKVQPDAIANLAKYEEQQLAYTDAKALWDEVKAIIDADDTGKKGDYQKELDDIYADMKAKGDNLYESYKNGKAVEEEVDFAAIKAQINNVKAKQSDEYNANVTADNLAGHNAVNTAIETATRTYQTAAANRETYRSSNAQLEAAISAAASDFDAALYSVPTELAKIKKDADAKYAAVVSPDKFDASIYIVDVEAKAKTITDEQEAFINAVKVAIKGYWDPMAEDYNQKVMDATSVINAYSKDAKKNAFKDVEDFIKGGQTAADNGQLQGVEDAIEALEGKIDNMLVADKNAAAKKDIDPRLNEAEAKYNEVKDYISGVSNDIPEKSDQLNILESKYNDGNYSNSDLAYAKTLAKTTANRDRIKNIVDNFIIKANDCKTTVEGAVAADNANTEAYERMVIRLNSVNDTLNDSKELVAKYKYLTDFDALDKQWAEKKSDIEDYKKNATAVSNEYSMNGDLSGLETLVKNRLIDAFNNEKSSLNTDITNVMNEYTQFVANGGDATTAAGYKDEIDALKTRYDALKIEDATAQITAYKQTVAASKKLIELQNDIADEQTKLAEVNKKQDNADVLADLIGAIDEMKTAATLDGKDSWVGEQKFNGETISNLIDGLKGDIAALEAEIQAEPNTAFFKDKFSKKVTDLEVVLKEVVDEAVRLQGIVDADLAAYNSIKGQLEQLQADANAAVEEIRGYHYKYNVAINSIKSNILWKIYDYDPYYDWKQGKLVDLEADHAEKNVHNKTLSYNSFIANGKSELTTQKNDAANYEAINYCDALTTDLNAAMSDVFEDDGKNYSGFQYDKLTSKKNDISKKITKFSNAINFSNTAQWYYDADNNWVHKDVTSYQDLPTHLQTYANIKAKIDALALEVENSKLGDITGNGKIDGGDYTSIIDIVIGNVEEPEAGTDAFMAADINGDGAINVIDATQLVNIILYGNPNGNAASRGASVWSYTTEPTMRIDNSNEVLSLTKQLVGNDIVRFGLVLKNQNSYANMQMNISLPDGMTLLSQKLGGRAAESHDVFAGNGRLLVMSAQNEAFTGNDGAVLYLDVKLDAQYNGAPVELSDIILTAPNGDYALFTALSGELTGIDTIAADESLKSKIYNMGGRLVDTLKKGVNIIRKADGSIVKAVKK